MTEISMIKRPFQSSRLNAGDKARLPQHVAQQWIDNGWAIYLSGDACTPGPELAKRDKRSYRRDRASIRV